MQKNQTQTITKIYTVYAIQPFQPQFKIQHMPLISNENFCEHPMIPENLKQLYVFFSSHTRDL